MLGDVSSNLLVSDPMRVYRAKRDAARKRVTDKYLILGFISSGTYGRVYKAQSKDVDSRIHAIKKFKPDKEGDVVAYTGISQSAIREIAVSALRLALLSFSRHPPAQQRNHARECRRPQRSHPRRQVHLYGL